MSTEPSPWRPMPALCLGFFILTVDATAMPVLVPVLIRDLDTDVTTGLWVISGYLLAYAVPLLLAGRLGDRFGPRNLFLTGLSLFVVASVGCGAAPGIGWLIGARVAQGLGAALMAPQTMAVITRTFPLGSRGAAMGVWGAVAGFATLVGPVLGGLLAQLWGWPWVFFINVPLGLVGLVLGAVLIPRLETSAHRFDVPGTLLYGVAMTTLVFAVQEGDTFSWSPMVWVAILAGVALLGVFVLHEHRTRREPLLPLSLFRDGNFSCGNVATWAANGAITALMVPAFLYTQTVLGLSPAGSALLLAPTALATIVLSVPAGRLSDRAHPRFVPSAGFALFLLATAWLALLMRPGTTVTTLLPAVLVLGVANACLWAPLSAAATRTLPPHRAGAAAGLFNTTRQLGAVIGSASIGAAMSLALRLQGIGGGQPAHAPPAGLSRALAWSMSLPLALIAIGLVAALMLGRRGPAHPEPAPTAGRAGAGGGP